jgi:hypothetical protein
MFVVVGDSVHSSSFRPGWRRRAGSSRVRGEGRDSHRRGTGVPTRPRQGDGLLAARGARQSERLYVLAAAVGDGVVVDARGAEADEEADARYAEPRRADERDARGERAEVEADAEDDAGEREPLAGDAERLGERDERGDAGNAGDDQDCGERIHAGAS